MILLCVLFYDIFPYFAPYLASYLSLYLAPSLMLHDILLYILFLFFHILFHILLHILFQALLHMLHVFSRCCIISDLIACAIILFNSPCRRLEGKPTKAQNSWGQDCLPLGNRASNHRGEPRVVTKPTPPQHKEASCYIMKPIDTLLHMLFILLLHFIWT